MNKVLLTDVDGVLLDWFGGFKAYLLERGISVKPQAEPDTWEMKEWIDHPNIQSLIAEFNASPEFGRLNAYPQAIVQLNKLHYTGHKIVAITSCSDDPATHKMRADNLKAEFGPIFDKVICLPLMQSKLAELKKYEPGDGTWWVEDSLHGATQGVEAGHNTLLIRRKYNIKAELDARIHRVVDWHAAYAVMAYE